MLTTTHFEAAGDFVLLEYQDRCRWNSAAISEASLLLADAEHTLHLLGATPGPYLL